MTRNPLELSWRDYLISGVSVYWCVHTRKTTVQIPVRCFTILSVCIVHKQPQSSLRRNITLQLLLAKFHLSCKTANDNNPTVHFQFHKAPTRYLPQNQ